MIKRIMKKFALSERGAKGFLWAVIACTAEGLALMIPVSLLYYLTDDRQDDQCKSRGDPEAVKIIMR